MEEPSEELLICVGVYLRTVMQARAKCDKCATGGRSRLTGGRGGAAMRLVVERTEVGPWSRRVSARPRAPTPGR